MQNNPISNLGRIGASVFRTAVFALAVFHASSVVADQRPVPTALEHDEGPARIVVMSEADFVPDRTGAAQSSSRGLPPELSGRIIEGLSGTKRFVPVEREVLRRVVMEERHERGPTPPTYLDRTLDAAIADLDSVEGITVGVTGALSDHNDLIKDFTDLGTTLKADFIVFGSLESASSQVEEKSVPYSKSQKTITEERVRARLRLRVIDVGRGSLAAASSVRVDRELLPEERSEPMAALYDDLSARAVGEILDRVFPASIVSAEPQVVDRGARDGIVPGRRFSAVRLNRAVKDSSGNELGSLETPIGEGEVATVQENVSFVRLLSGGPLAMGDRIKFEAAAPGLSPRGETQPAASVPAKGKKTIGVLRFDKNTSLGNCDDRCAGLLARISNELTVKLLKSNRFTVMEREEVDKLLSEKELTSLITDESVRSLARKLGTVDYLVYGDITDGYFNSTTTHLKILGEDHTKREGVYEGTVKIVEAASGKLLTAEKVAVRERMTGVYERDLDAGLSHLLDKFTERATALVLGAVYPIAVLGVTPDGVIYVNRGLDGGLVSGDRFRIERAGAPLIEEESGIDMGSARTTIGTLTIDEVEQFRSKGSSSTAATLVLKGDSLVSIPTVPTPKPDTVRPKW